MKLYYFCDTCGKSYANKASLRLHKLHVHEKYSEEVPCDVCGISFRTRELLKQHQEREHSIEPKFACEECGQRFGNSYHLKRHMTSHSPDGFPCSHCSRVFKRKDGLDTHFSNAHRDVTGEMTNHPSQEVKPATEEPSEEQTFPGMLEDQDGDLDLNLFTVSVALEEQAQFLPLNFGEPLQEEFSNPEPPTPVLSHLSVRDGFNSAVNSILNRDIGMTRSEHVSDS